MKGYLPLALAGTVALGALAGCGSTPTTTTAAPSVFTTIDESHGITPGAPINPFNPNGNSFGTYDKMQMAYFTYSATNSNSFWPGLASKWKAVHGGTAVDVWIQPNAKWSNGQAVTAQDFKTSAAIWFTQGNAQYYDLGNVKILGPKEVQFDEIPGDHIALFEHYLMQQLIVPASVWGKLLPKNIWQTIATANGTNATAAQTATTTLTNLGKTIAAYAPKKDVSAGPFVLQAVNPGEAILVKNPDFYDASQIKVSKVVMRNYTGNQQIWNYQMAGSLDFAPYTAMPTNILNEILAKKGNKEVVATSYVTATLAFNQHMYPYNLLAVRKAIAHVLNRQTIQKIAEPVSGSVSKWSDGLVDNATKQWLTPSEIASLRPYNHSLSKATSELKSAGFTQKGGKWYLPNGKPWTATIYTVNGFSDWIAADHVMSSELTSFGIPTQPQIVSSYSQYLKELGKGLYGMGFWIAALGPNPHSAFLRVYGPNDGFNLVGGKLVHYPPNATQGNWEDTPTSLPLPNGTKINVGQLTASLALTTNVAAMKPTVQKLALATNANLPQITLWNYILVEFINTTRFTNFPINNGGLLQYPAGLWMMRGYVQPK